MSRTRILVVIVAAVVFVSFGFASWSLKVSLDERNRRADLAAHLAKENEQRIMRACERQDALIRFIDPLLPGVALAAELATIDRKYPQLKACPTKGG